MDTQINIGYKLFKKKSALWSLIFLAVTIIISIFSYLIIPDNSPNSNNQHLSIALKDPGYRTEVLLFPKKIEHVKDQNFIEKLFYGNKNNPEWLPFLDLKFEGKSIQVTSPNGSNQIFPITIWEPESVSLKAFKNRHTSKKTFLFGTDKFGRDILSRLILGIRLSIFIGLMSVVLSLIIGILIGASGGYFGGRIDNMIMYLINITWSIPTLLLVFAIVLALGRGMSIVFLAIGLTLWVDVARIVRGQVLKVKEEEFVTAAKSLSFSPFRVISKHILPNIIGPLLVITATNFAVAILIEAGLSYLGFGIQPPIPSVGNMLHENYGYAISGKPFLALVPAITIMLLVLAFNLVGSGLRDIVDVKSIR